MATLAPFDQNKVNHAVFRVFTDRQLRNNLIEFVESRNYIGGRTTIRHALKWSASQQNMTTVVALEVMVRIRMILFNEESTEAEGNIISAMPGWMRDGFNNTSYDEAAITIYLISNNLSWSTLKKLILGQPASPEPEPEPKETTMNSTTCDTSDTNTPVIETRVMIHGKFADTMTDTEIFQLIARLEQNVETLDKIKNKPKKLKNKIKEIEDSIQKLSEYVDGR